jgi:hypothetical protein
MLRNLAIYIPDRRRRRRAIKDKASRRRRGRKFTRSIKDQKRYADLLSRGARASRIRGGG